VAGRKGCTGRAGRPEPADGLDPSPSHQDAIVDIDMEGVSKGGGGGGTPRAAGGSTTNATINASSSGGRGKDGRGQGGQRVYHERAISMEADGIDNGGRIDGMDVDTAISVAKRLGAREGIDGSIVANPTGAASAVQH
jgi:hypothetical protein